MTGSRVVVIGAGPGGSAFAALMAFRGHDVTLLEKNSFAGGKCSSLSRDGYIVDTGVHMFGRGPLGPFGHISRILGEGPTWSAAVPSFTLSLSGRGRLEMCSSITHPRSILSFIKGRVKGWQKMEWASTAFKAIGHLGPAGLYTLTRKFNDGRYPLYGELQDVSARDFFTSLSDSDDFLRTFHAQAMLTMAVPWQRASMGEFAYILASTMRASHLCYPYGGSGAIPASYIGSMKKAGGRLRLGCEVTGIDVADGRVRGVTTGEGEHIPADLVVSSAGLRNTIAMAGQDRFPSEYLERAGGLRDSEAFIAVKFLLDRKLTSMRTPCLLHMPDISPHNMFDYLEGGSVPEDLFLFVTSPGKWDPALVPPGGDAVIVGVPAPSRLDRRQQAEALLDRTQQLALQLLPELTFAQEVERLYPGDIAGLSGRAAGDCIGLAQEVGQSGSSRPSPATPVHGLYLVGADAGGRGIGTEMAADSALYLYHQLKEYGMR